MEFQIRELQLPEDYEGMAAVWNEFLPEPVTAAELEDEDRKMYDKGELSRDADGKLTGYDRLRRVAVAEDGRIVAYTSIWRAPWTAPGTLYLSLMVLKRERGKGIGAGLSRMTRDWARQNGADTIMSEVWDDDERSLVFVRRFGFEVERRAWQSVLDLASGEDPASAEDAAVVERLEDEGIRFVSLADLSPSEAVLKRLHALETATYPDIPGFTGDAMPFEDWLKWSLQVEGYAPERVIVALEGDLPVGMCNIIRNEHTGGMYHQYTCVAREYRGRGIALALKLLSIRLALRQGAGYLRTDNDSMNVGMLAVNRRLGYKALRGRYRVVAKL